jgi:hypothetical protein
MQIYLTEEEIHYTNPKKTFIKNHFCQLIIKKILSLFLKLSEGAMEVLDYCLNCDYIISTPNTDSCPTLFQIGEGSMLHEKTTRHKHTQVTPQVAPPQETVNKTEHGGVRFHTTPYTPGTKQKHRETHRMLTLFPTLCLQKSPPGPERLATAPVSWLAAMLTVWREKGDCLTQEITYSLSSIQNNLFRKCSESKLNMEILD